MNEVIALASAILVTALQLIEAGLETVVTAHVAARLARVEAPSFRERAANLALHAPMGKALPVIVTSELATELHGVRS